MSRKITGKQIAATAVMLLIGQAAGASLPAQALSRVSQYMMSAPAYDTTLVAEAEQVQTNSLFNSGRAGAVEPEALVRSGAFVSDPMTGGIYKRRQQVQYVIVHSTETARPADASRVIRSWSNKGRRHAGAQFVVDRDGLIHMAVTPDLATVHVEVTRTLGGVNNDNSVGIEIVRAGEQEYTGPQLASVQRLVLYLQQRYNVDPAAVLGHGAVQPSNRTDPVGFDWTTFQQEKVALQQFAGSDAIASLDPQIMPLPGLDESVIADSSVGAKAEVASATEDPALSAASTTTPSAVMPEEQDPVVAMTAEAANKVASASMQSSPLNYFDATIIDLIGSFFARFSQS